MPLLTACQSNRGPDFVIDSHLAYNKAVSQVVSEELLLNIVRRRYLEAPQFVSVDSISARMEVERDFGLSGSYDISGDSGSGPDFTFAPGAGLTISGTTVDASDWSPVGFDAGITFSETPTITFTPRQGEEIAAKLHAPMSPSILADMANVGYRFDLLLTLLVQEINGVRSVDAGLGESFRGGSAAFSELVGLVRELSLSDELVLGSFKFEDSYNSDPIPAAQITPEHWLTAIATQARWRSYDGGENYFLTDSKLYPAIWMSDSTKESEKGQRVLELLNLDADALRTVWPIKSSKTVAGPNLSTRGDTPRETVAARLRSFYGVMNLLVYGVDVPLDDDAPHAVFADDGYTRAVEAGQFVDLREAFRIHSSPSKPLPGLAASTPIVPGEEPPQSAFVSVAYRGHWYYIDDADVVSKRIFNALFDLFNLQVAKSGSSSAPVLTLPVN